MGTTSNSSNPQASIWISSIAWYSSIVETSRMDKCLPPASHSRMESSLVDELVICIQVYPASKRKAKSKFACAQCGWNTDWADHTDSTDQNQRASDPFNPLNPCHPCSIS